MGREVNVVLLITVVGSEVILVLPITVVGREVIAVIAVAFDNGIYSILVLYKSCGVVCKVCCVVFSVIFIVTPLFVVLTEDFDDGVDNINKYNISLNTFN